MLIVLLADVILTKSMCVLGEDQVARFDCLVTGITGLEQRLAGKLAVIELTETPSTRRGVFFEPLIIYWTPLCGTSGLISTELMCVQRHKFLDAHRRPAGQPLHTVGHPVIPARPV
jgi:hypothetical protein